MEINDLTAGQRIAKYVEFNRITPTKPDSYISDQPPIYSELTLPDAFTRNPLLSMSNSKPEQQTQKEEAPNPIDSGDIQASLVDDGDVAIDHSSDFSSKFKMPTLNLSQKEIVKSIEDSKYDPDMKKYLKLLAYKESGYNPNVVNRFGYAGLYQFGKKALDWVGMDKSTYMSDINEQHKAAAKLGENNFKMLKDYVGKKIDGITLTKVNLMAAAHLGGAGSVKKWVESNGQDDFKDGNNTPISKYLKDFSV